MDSLNPLVSVVVPVHDGERYLAQALASIFAQDYRPIEVIVVDDGSSDASASIASGFPDLRLIRQDNAGVSAARNTGIAAARGAFVAFLDADDLWLPNKLSRHVTFHLQHPKIGYTVAGVRNFLSDREQPPTWLTAADIGEDKVGYLPGNLFVSRATFDRVGGFDPDFRVGEGAEWFARAKDAGVLKAILPEVLLLRRAHPANQTNDLARIRSGVLRALKASIDRQREADAAPGSNQPEHEP